MDEYQIREKFIVNIQREMEANPFAPLNRLIYNELYTEIIEGHLLPKHRLIESKIASSLNVSRSPVKLALQELESKGILERDKGISPHVKVITYEECYYVWEVRMALEPEVAFAAAKRICNDELLQIDALLSGLEQEVSDHCEKSYTDTDKKFHEMIIRFSKNPYYKQMYKAIEFPLACYRHQLEQLHHGDLFIENGLKAATSYHRAIYDMLKAHLPLLARDAMREDIQRMYGTMSRMDW